MPPEEYNDPTPCKPDDYSDVGQAYAFAKHCCNYVRYSPATDYIVYDGVCWQESKPRSQAAMQQFTDTQLAEAEAWLTRAEERMEETGAKAVIAAHGKNASEFMTEEQKSALFAQRGVEPLPTEGSSYSAEIPNTKSQHCVKPDQWWRSIMVNWTRMGFCSTRPNIPWTFERA